MAKRKSKAKHPRVKKRSAKRERVQPSVKKRRSIPKKRRAKPKRPKVTPQIASAIREMNRGRSLTATAKSLHLSPKRLQKELKAQRLVRRKGRRWAITDLRRRRIPVMTKGKQQTLVVIGYAPARLIGEHHNAVGEFVRTNDITVLKPFEGQAVIAANGRKYPLETDPNVLHRIASMDNLPFHEIYEITSSN